MVLKIGAIIGKYNEAEKFAGSLINKIESDRRIGEQRKSKPKVYFEEWYNPLIVGSKWVSEIIEICGGIDIYKEKAHKYDAKDRIINNQKEVLDFNPDIYLASWCGKPFKRHFLDKREDWNKLNMIKSNNIYEIDSAIILQPGPAPIIDGIDLIMNIFDNWEVKSRNS